MEPSQETLNYAFGHDLDAAEARNFSRIQQI